MSPQRIHDKMTSVLNRLIWVEDCIAPSLQQADAFRLERLEGLQNRLVDELLRLSRYLPDLPQALHDRLRSQVLLLRQKRDGNARLVSETRALCERFFGEGMDAGYRADGRPAGREARTFVRMTA
ncbi:MAG: hypothetical protein J0L75_20325 [Spirochaetes bacterium]|nr:hypothetical protein [Spirochaetota bacterium]